MTPQQANPEFTVVVPPPPHAAPTSEWRQRSLFELLEAAPAMARRAAERCTQCGHTTVPPVHVGRPSGSPGDTEDRATSPSPARAPKAGPRSARRRKTGPFRKASAASSASSQVMTVLDFIRSQEERGATRGEIAVATDIRLNSVCGHVGTLLGLMVSTPRRPEVRRSGRTRPGPTGLPNEVLVAIGGQ